jgi:hypothetical protein
MRIILSVAFYEDVQRAKNFVESVSRTKNLDNVSFVFLMTGGNETSVRISSELLKLPRKYIKRIEGRKRLYSQIMFNKFHFASEVCQDDDVYWNADDDYVFNPYWADFVIKLFSENPEIQYLSLLKEKFFYEKVNIKSGFSMGIQPTCMGGALGIRWSTFKEHMSEWLTAHQVSDESPGYGGMFDVEYWPWLHKKMGTRDVVYAPSDFSLIQHCNLVSNYLETKANRVSHMYATNFDPCCNPFNLL